MQQLMDYSHGDDMALYVLIKSADIRTARNGNPFIAFRFQDRSGSMDGMYWSASEQEINQFQAGHVVYLKGKRDTYNGSPQVKIEGLRLAEVGEPNDPTMYVERVAMKREEVEEQLDQALLLIRDSSIARVVRHIVSRVGEDFFAFPAAKRNHHAIAGGLSVHTLTMVQIGKQLCEIYPQLNQSLLIGGIILHDLGKTIELSGPISTEYTLKGQLIGHIVIINDLINQACLDLDIDADSESILLLKHLVLAHHGQLDYGSPVMPHILEAEVIHYIDDMDAKINMITSALEHTEKGEFSAQIFPLDRRSFYRPNLNK